MQRVTNCVLIKNNHVLMLKKPSHGWWVAPGGKMELRESIIESATREYQEETGVVLKKPYLRGIFTVVIEENGIVINEWMMFTFQADDYSGQVLEQSPEGELAWVPMGEVRKLPMALGDYPIFQHILYESGLIYGTFTYGKGQTLLSYRLEADTKPIQVYEA